MGDAKRQSTVEETARSIHGGTWARNGVWKHVAAAVPEEHEVGERLDIGGRNEEVCNVCGVLQEIRGGLQLRLPDDCRAGVPESIRSLLCSRTTEPVVLSKSRRCPGLECSRRYSILFSNMRDKRSLTSERESSPSRQRPPSSQIRSVGSMDARLYKIDCAVPDCSRTRPVFRD